MPISPRRHVFFISDHTGITAETLGRSLLSQFDHIDFVRTTLNSPTPWSASGPPQKRMTRGPSW